MNHQTPRRFLSGSVTEPQMLDAVNFALDKKELPALEGDAMAYMLSKQAYLGRTN